MFNSLKDIFNCRQLILGLAIKDLRIKYRRASGGFGWMLINPLVQMCLFIFIFKVIFKVGIKNYPLFLLCGLFPWAYMAAVINDASMCIIHNSSLIKKTHFPRQALPLSVVLTQSVSFLFPLLVLFAFSFINNPKMIASLIWLPLIILIQATLLSGLALIVSCLNVRYRDTNFIINILLMVWFYATPIVYPMEMAKKLLPEWGARLYQANPMGEIIIVYQDIFFYGRPPDFLPIIGLIFISLFILAAGILVFNKHEAAFEELL